MKGWFPLYSDSSSRLNQRQMVVSVTFEIRDTGKVIDKVSKVSKVKQEKMNDVENA